MYAVELTEEKVEAADLIAAARAVVGKFSTPGGEIEAGSVAAAILTGSGAIYTGICIDAQSSVA